MTASRTAPRPTDPWPGWSTVLDRATPPATVVSGHRARVERRTDTNGVARGGCPRDSALGALRDAAGAGAMAIEGAGATTFAAVLRRHRHAAGLTQAALAERAALDTRTVSDLECGRRRAPQRATASALGDGLGLPATERLALERLAATQRRLQRHARRAEGCAAAAGPTCALASAPSSPPALIGRRRELAELGALLADDRVRLVTLVGPVGVGTSRLAAAH